MQKCALDNLPNAFLLAKHGTPFIPDELWVKILSFNFENKNQIYLTCKKWVKLFHCRVIPQLLNDRKIFLSEIPFCYASKVNLYIDFLYQKTSFENLKMFDSPSLQPSFAYPCRIQKLTSNEFFAINPKNMEYMIADVTKLQLNLFSKIEFPIFSNLKELKITSNSNLDLCYFPYLNKISINLCCNSISDLPLIKINFNNLFNLNTINLKARTYSVLKLDPSTIIPSSVKIANFNNIYLHENFIPSDSKLKILTCKNIKGISRPDLFKKFQYMECINIIRKGSSVLYIRDETNNTYKPN